MTWTALFHNPVPAVSEDVSKKRVAQLVAAGCKIERRRLPDGTVAVLIKRPRSEKCRKAAMRRMPNGCRTCGD